jgi:signal transduction histidine kinase
VAALILVSAGGLLTHWLFQYQESSLTFGFLVACLTSAFVISSMIALYIQRTAHLNTSLLEVESELASVVSSIKQRRWVERSRVVTQLQGQVQGALVAAVNRLSDISDPDRIEKAKNDLDRASLAMYQIDQDPTDLVSAMEAMREAWLGICQIDFDLDQKAVKLCASNPTVTSVTAALITEGVVNAVRHGKATQVQVVIESAKGRTLRLAVLDNGKLKDKKSRGGGVALINELTNSWSLQRRDKKTVLEMFVSHLDNRNA